MEAEKRALGPAEGLWCPCSGWLSIGAASGCHNYCSVLATSDCEHTNVLIGDCSVSGWVLKTESTFPFTSVLFAEGFRGAKIHCKGKNLFLFEEGCSNHGFSSEKMIFRCWQVWVAADRVRMRLVDTPHLPWLHPHLRLPPRLVSPCRLLEKARSLLRVFGEWENKQMSPKCRDWPSADKEGTVLSQGRVVGLFFFLLIKALLSLCWKNGEFAFSFFCYLCQPTHLFNFQWLELAKNRSLFGAVGRRTADLWGGRPSLLHLPFSLSDRSASDGESHLGRRVISKAAHPRSSLL